MATTKYPSPAFFGYTVREKVWTVVIPRTPLAWEKLTGSDAMSDIVRTALVKVLLRFLTMIVMAAVFLSLLFYAMIERDHAPVADAKALEKAER